MYFYHALPKVIILSSFKQIKKETTTIDHSIQMLVWANLGARINVLSATGLC